MPTYRYWTDDEEEDPENDPTIEEVDEQEAAEAAAAEMINDGDLPVRASNKMVLIVRMIKPSMGEAKIFEVFVDWSPTCTAYPRGVIAE
jgi:hypothetical protein